MKFGRSKTKEASLKDEPPTKTAVPPVAVDDEDSRNHSGDGTTMVTPTRNRNKNKSETEKSPRFGRHGKKGNKKTKSARSLKGTEERIDIGGDEYAIVSVTPKSSSKDREGQYADAVVWDPAVYPDGEDEKEKEEGQGQKPVELKKQRFSLVRKFSRRQKRSMRAANRGKSANTNANLIEEDENDEKEIEICEGEEVDMDIGSRRT